MKKVYLYAVGIALIGVIVYYTYIANNLTVLTAAKPLNVYEPKTLDSVLTDSKYIIQNRNDETEDSIVSIYYPKTINSTFDLRIKEIVKKYEDKLTELVDNKKKNKTNDKKCEMFINFDVVCYSQDVMSVVFYITIETYEGNPYTSIETISYDLKNDKVIGLSDLYENNNNYLYELSNFCYNKLKNDENIKKFGAEEMLKEGTKGVKNNYTKFAIGENCVVFYFAKNQIAPYAAGMFKVSVLFSEVNNIFTK